MEPECILKPFECCKGCSYLGKRLQQQYQTGIYIMLSFCRYYDLHFSSVRQIINDKDVCIHYDEGHL